MIPGGQGGNRLKARGGGGFINLTPCVPLSLGGWEKERGRENERGWRPSRWSYSFFKILLMHKILIIRISFVIYK
jgi:hypothetical protein